jgi:ribose transport system ATP-binding protein
MRPLLTIEHLSKTFPGQRALDDVSLEVGAGQTHALVGQNGSGKSTLIKILAGYHQPTGDSSAVLHLDGADVPLVLGDGEAAARAGVRFVHQDLGLVGNMSSVENIALGTGYTTRRRRIDWKAEVARVERELADIGFGDIPVTAPVDSLAPSQRTAVAVARALRNWESGATLLVLDEPTASLPGADVERLFEAIRRLKARGVSILYVSHHLDEVFQIADVVTVLRDGRNVASVAIDAVNHDSLIELMIGHRIQRGRAAGSTATSSEASDAALLCIRDLAGGNLHGVDLDIAPGEVVGVAGITGSGRESIVPLVTGQIVSRGGTVQVAGTFIRTYQPDAAIESGMAFVAADRVQQGIIPTMSVQANTTMGSLQRHTKLRRLIHHLEVSEVRDWIHRLRIKTAHHTAPIVTLSGGNQQKVLFARGLRLGPRVIALDEPTRGVDVGAKEEIHLLIDTAAAGGAAVLVASTDSDELVRLAHRVIIMRGGVITGQLRGSEISVENIERSQLASAGALASQEAHHD